MNELEERNWGMFCHLAALAGLIIPLGNLIGPLVVWLIKRNESSYVDAQGKESLNFQISMTIYAIVAAFLVLVLIGIVLLIAVYVVNFILVIVASVNISSGKPYRYPLAIRFLH